MPSRATGVAYARIGLPITRTLTPVTAVTSLRTHGDS